MKPLIEFPFNPTLTNPYVSYNRGVAAHFQRDYPGQGDDIQGNPTNVGIHNFRFKKVGNKHYITFEPTATNYIYSNDFSKWTLGPGINLYRKTQIAPTGIYDADEMVYPAAVVSAEHGTSLVSTSKTVVFSVWIRSASGTHATSLVLLSSGGEDGNTNFNFTATTTWTRYFVKKIFSAGATGTVVAAIFNTNAVPGTIFVYGAQLEEGSSPTSLISTTPTSFSNPNLIIDGDMESPDTAAWTTFGSVTSYTKDTGIVKFGARSQKIVVSAAASGILQLVPTVTGKSYTVSGWFYSVDVLYVSIVAGGFGGQGTAGTGSWQFLKQSLVATGPATNIALYLASPGTIYVDNLELREQNCPDPSFEGPFTTSPPPPWTGGGTASVVVSRDTAIGHSGAAAIRVAADDTEGIQLLGSDLNLAVNTYYRYSAWVWIVSQSGPSVFPIMYINADLNEGTTIFVSSKSVVGVWQRIEAVCKTSGVIGPTANFGIILGTTGVSDYIIDDVAVEPMDSPLVGGARGGETLTIPLRNGQRHNYLLYSQDFENPYWSKNLITLLNNDTVAPDGTLTADRITSNGVGANLNQYASKLVVPGATYTFSVWMKSRTGVVDPSNSAPSVLLLNDGVHQGAVIIEITNQWRRYFITKTMVMTATHILCMIYHETPAADYWIWGAQLEMNNSPSPYIRTTEPIREKMFANYASQNFVERQGSVSFWAVLPWWGDGSNDLKLIIGAEFAIYRESGDTNLIRLNMRGRNKSGVVVTKTAVVSPTTLDATNEHFFAFTWYTKRDLFGKAIASVMRIVVDGHILETLSWTDVQEWGFDSSDVFRVSDGTYTHSYIRDFKIWPAALTDADLTELYVTG